VVEGDKPLLNVYSVMEVNPANGPRVNAAAGKAFADFMVAPETQAVIRAFGVEKYGHRCSCRSATGPKTKAAAKSGGRGVGERFRTITWG